MKQTKFFLAVAICLLINSFAFSQVNEKRMDSLKMELKKFIEKKMADYKVVGLSIALVDNQETVWAEGFGYSDREKKQTVTPQTIFRIGSISKLFTASAVMQLAEDGKINIDNDIKTYIPEFKIKSRFKNPGTITPRNLMTHHSGLPSDIPYKWDSEKAYPFTSCVELLNQEYTCTQPNTIFSYSNVGISLLGVLVEKVSGENFFDYTQKHLFQVMDMKNSSFQLEGHMVNQYSKSYFKGKEFLDPMIRDVPAGSIHTNVLDMTNFIKMTFNNGNYNGNQILKPETLNEMQTVQNKDCKLDFAMTVIGLNWGVQENAGNYAGKLCGHTGATTAFNADIRTLNDHKIGVIVMSNTDDGAAIVGSVSLEILKKYLELKKGMKAPAPVKTAPVKFEDGNTSVQSIAGGYFLPDYGFLNFKAKGNKLIAKYSIGKIVLTPTGRGTFESKIQIAGGLFSKKLNMELLFKKMDTLNLVLIVSKQKLYFGGVKISKPNITNVWKQRLGKYNNINEDLKHTLAKTLEITENDGYICAKIINFSDDEILNCVLTPVSENQAIVAGLGKQTGMTLFFEGDEIYLGGIKLKK